MISCYFCTSKWMLQVYPLPTILHNVFDTFLVFTIRSAKWQLITMWVPYKRRWIQTVQILSPIMDDSLAPKVKLIMKSRPSDPCPSFIRSGRSPIPNSPGIITISDKSPIWGSDKRVVLAGPNGGTGFWPVWNICILQSQEVFEKWSNLGSTTRLLERCYCACWKVSFVFLQKLTWEQPFIVCEWILTGYVHLDSGIVSSSASFRSKVRIPWVVFIFIFRTHNCEKSGIRWIPK